MTMSNVSALEDRDVLVDAVCSAAAWCEHDQLQRSFLSCSSYLQPHGLLEGAQIARIVTGDTTKCSLAIRIARRSATVLGALTSSAKDFAFVAHRLLERDGRLRYVRSELLVRDPEIEADPRVVIIRQANDMSRTLPGSMEDFDVSLGKKRLKDIRYHERHFLRHFPEAKVVIKHGEEMTSELFGAVVELHRARMRVKGHTSGVDALQEERMYQVVKQSGFVVLLLNGREIAAALVAFMTARDGYFWMIAHDARYDAFGPGITCLYAGFRYLISCGVERMHFLWGDSNYKRQFGTEPTKTASYVVLRSRLYIWSIVPLLYSYYRENVFGWIVRQASENRSLVKVYRQIRRCRVFSIFSVREGQVKAGASAETQDVLQP